jgi:hypothetical protein
VYVLKTDGTIWRELNDPQDRRQVDAHIAHFQAVNEGLIFVLDDRGRLWRERPKTAERDKITDNVMLFQAISYTDTFYLWLSNRDLWHDEDGSRGHKWVDGNVWDFQAINDNVVYVLGTDLTLWREPGQMAGRGQVGQNVVEFQGINETLVYVLTEDGRLWRSRHNVGVPDEVDEVDDNVSLKGARAARLIQR